MIIEVLCVIFISYLMYRQGMRQLFKSRILENRKADHIAYSLFMLSGLLLGSYFSLSLIFLWTESTHEGIQIVVAFITSISAGEWMYLRNKHLVYKMISPQSKDSKK
jgi:Zn-dependent protease with chaperone function